MRLSLPPPSLLFVCFPPPHTLFFFFLMLRFLRSSAGCSRMKGTSWPTRNRLMLPDVEEFPYPQDAMPMFVLQVEQPWKDHGGHVKELSFLPLAFCTLSSFFFPFPVSFSHLIRSLSHKRLDTRVKPLLVLLILGEDNKYDETCHRRHKWHLN